MAVNATVSPAEIAVVLALKSAAAAAAVIGAIPGANMATTGAEPYYSTITFSRGVT